MLKSELLVFIFFVETTLILLKSELLNFHYYYFSHPIYFSYKYGDNLTMAYILFQKR